MKKGAKIGSARSDREHAASLAKHTPGPWRIEGALIRGTPIAWPVENPDSIQRVNQTVVATVWHGEGGEYGHYSKPVAAANARLIAAAPAMLAALKKLAEDWPFLTTGDETEISGADFLEAVAAWFREYAAPAMAKAEGRVP